ncbi:MAG: DUF72 domain-containing protein [Nitrospirota bacterium]
MAHIFIGLSGYSYKPWQGPGRFYPEGLKSSEFLRYYATRYRTVELDGVWYRLPTEQTVRSWIEQTPSTFFFAPKAHRQITHMSRLKPEALSFAQLMLDRLAPLAESRRLGPILLQLPPNLRRDDARLADFLGKLPQGFRWAVEFRHDSWRVAEVEKLLTQHGVAWAAADTDEQPAERRDTAGFCYVRLRRSAYDETALAEWAEWLEKEAQAGKECFVYLKHEDEGSPWVWADHLLRLAGS